MHFLSYFNVIEISFTRYSIPTPSTGFPQSWKQSCSEAVYVSKTLASSFTSIHSVPEERLAAWAKVWSLMEGSPVTP